MSRLPLIEPPVGLAQQITERLFARMRWQARFRLVGFSGLGLVALASGVWFSWTTIGIIQQAGWGSYLLLLNDPTMVVAAGKELIFVLLESAPVIYLTTILAALALMLWSLQRLVREVSFIRPYYQLKI